MYISEMELFPNTKYQFLSIHKISHKSVVKISFIIIS